MTLRNTLLVLGLAAAVAGGVFAYLRCTGTSGAGSGAGFAVADLRGGRNGDALTGRVKLPRGVEIGGPKGERLQAVDSAGDRFPVRLWADGRGGCSFAIPGGYPCGGGKASLQLFRGEKLVGKAPLGALPAATHPAFAVRAAPGVSAFRRGSLISVRVPGVSAPEETACLVLLATNNQSFPSGRRVEMGARGPGLLGAEIELPYADSVDRLEFEVQVTHYTPDEVTVPNATLVVAGDRIALKVTREARLVTRHGRRLLLPAQCLWGPLRERYVGLRMETTGDPPTDRFGENEAVRPRARDLGLALINVGLVRAGPRRGPLTPGMGIFVPPPPRRDVHLGPTGPLLVRLRLKDGVRVESKRYAVSVTAPPPSLLAP